MARMAKLLLILFLVMDHSVIQAARAAEMPVATDLVRQAVTIRLLRDFVATQDKNPNLRNFVAGTLTREGYSKSEVADSLREFDSTRRVFMPGGAFGCEKALACLSLRSDSREQQLIEIIGISEAGIEARINGHPIDLVKGQDLRLKERVKQVSGTHASLLDRIYGLIVPSAQANVVILGIALAIALIAAAQVLGEAAHYIAGYSDALYRKLTLGGDFCCKFEAAAKKKFEVYQRNGARCFEDLAGIFNGNKSRAEAMKLETVKQAKSWILNSQDDDLLAELQKSESVSSAVTDEVQKILRTCRRVDSVYERSVTSVKINNDVACVEKFQKAEKFISESQDIALSYQGCLNLVRDDNLLKNANNYDYYRKNRQSEFQDFQKRFSNASTVQSSSPEGSSAAGALVPH